MDDKAKTGAFGQPHASDQPPLPRKVWATPTVITASVAADTAGKSTVTPFGYESHSPGSFNVS